MALRGINSIIKWGLFQNCSKMLPTVTSVRWSRYSDIYIDPISNKEKISELEETGKLQEYAFVPVKTCPNNITSSVFYDPVLHNFANIAMKTGNKKLSIELINKAFERIKRIQLAKYHAASENDKPNIECNPLVIFHKAIENSTPVIIVASFKRGGITYQVPTPITPKRGRFMAMRWLIHAARDKHRKIHFPEQLAKELIDAYNNTGRVIKEKQDIHKHCEANKAYAHYRWA